MSDTESFESVMERVNAEIAEIEAEDRPFPYRLSANVLRNLRDRLRRAHDREIRDTAQQQYHRGYDDGMHSMDAEHRAVAMRLRQLPLDGGSVENVFNIARAVYHNDFGWAANNCAGLRDELVHLMGGVSDENVHVGGLRCVDGYMGDVSNGEDTWRTHDSPSNLDRNHMAVRVGVDTVIGGADDTCGSQCRGACAADCGRDSGEQEVSDGRVADDSGAVVRCGDGGGDLHMAGVRITDELRKWASDRHCKGMSHTDVLNIGLIADRIDEQFDRICQQQEAVLQSTISEVVEKCDHLKHVAETNSNALLRMGGENARLHADCEKLRKRLDSITEAIEHIKSLGQE